MLGILLSLSKTSLCIAKLAKKKILTLDAKYYYYTNSCVWVGSLWHGDQYLALDGSVNRI